MKKWIFILRMSFWNLSKMCIILNKQIKLKLIVYMNGIIMFSSVLLFIHIYGKMKLTQQITDLKFSKLPVV